MFKGEAVGGSGQHVIDVRTATFEKDVIERSAQIPVVVDFWAPWCAPCRQLGPILEKVVGEYGGRMILAKVNVEECQDLAMAFGVQSIPMVVAVKNKQIVDQFMGALPEKAIREWMGGLLPSAEEEMLREAAETEKDNLNGAERKYREVLERKPKHDQALLGLARVLAGCHRDAEALEVIGQLAARGFLEPEGQRIKAELELRAAAGEDADVAGLRRQVDATPGDHGLRIKLADALAVKKRYQEAMDQCLLVIERDKVGAGVSAKETMVKILNLIGNQPELASQYRRKLATLLY